MTYTVGPNETISDIAQNFDVPVEELLSFNNLNWNSWLVPGMIIYIPPRRPRPPVRPVPPIMPLPPSNFVYIVRRGDTIWTIARRFDVSVQNIMFMNGLKFPFVFPGQRLIIPIAIMPF